MSANLLESESEEQIENPFKVVLNYSSEWLNHCIVSEGECPGIPLSAVTSTFEVSEVGRIVRKKPPGLNDFTKQRYAIRPHVNMSMDEQNDLSPENFG